MFIDRFSVRHRVPIPLYIRLAMRRAIRCVPDVLVRPLDTSINTAFVVGCGHSGTTLVAAKLGRLEACFLPGWETSFFLPDQGLYWSKAAFGTLLKIARHSGKQLVLEKTPKHVHCINRIRRLLPQAKFLVVTRNPIDTCSSLYRRVGDLDEAIERWNLDNRATLQLVGDPAALWIRYEDLTENPELVFSIAAKFIGAEWHPDALAEGPTPFSVDAEDPTFRIRALQVTEIVSRRSENDVGDLTENQIETIRVRTQHLARKIGY